MKSKVTEFKDTMYPLNTFENLKGYATNSYEIWKYISTEFSKPFEFKVVSYKLKFMSGIVAYLSKHQSSDVFEFRNIELKQIFQKQIRRNDLRRLNWHHFVFTSFSHKFGSRKLNYQISYFKKSNGQTEKVWKKIVLKEKEWFHDNIYKDLQSCAWCIIKVLSVNNVSGISFDWCLPKRALKSYFNVILLSLQKGMKKGFWTQTFGTGAKELLALKIQTTKEI